MIKIKRNSHSILIPSINFYPFLTTAAVSISRSPSFSFFFYLRAFPIYRSINPTTRGKTRHPFSLFPFIPPPSILHSLSPSPPISHQRFLHPFSRPHSSQLHFLLHHKYFSMVIDPLGNDHLPVTIYL